jgi:hypothetical protein
LSRREVRESFAGVARPLWHPKIVVPIVAMIAYVLALVRVGWLAGIWNSHLVEGTIVWFMGSAVVLLFNLTKAWEKPRFFRRVVLRTLEITVFLAFFLNIFVFSLPVELVLQPVLFLLVTIPLVAGREARYKPVKEFVEALLALTGLVIASFSVIRVIKEWDQLDGSELFLEFVLPIWLTLGLLPFIYLVALYAAHESAFGRINFMLESRRSRRRAKLALLTVTLGRMRLLNGFGGYWAKEAGSAESLAEGRRVIKKFLASRRQREAEIEEEKARLVRNAGIVGTDANGRQLDEREFKETTQALRWLATCQMGWYQNHGGAYRADMLEIMNQDLTSQGLPEEHGITMHVAEDGQSWWAWRRTITGWCFAIGAAGAPPDQREFDGPEPPGGFPGEDTSWGHGAFTLESNRNW